MKRRRHDIPNITTTAAAVIIIFATIMEVLPPANSQEVARLRCQKSGCREADGLEEPTLIVSAASSSPGRTKVFPLLTSWIVAFFLLRLLAHYIRKLIPIIRREAPEIRAVVGHYFHSMMDLATSERNNTNSGQQRMKKGRNFSTTRSSNKSLGSLAELLDDSGRSGRGTSLWYDNDSTSSAGYSSSAYTSYTDDDDKLQSAAEFGSSVYSESTGSSYYSHDKNDDDQSRGGESIVSKFLSYISETKGHHHGYDAKRRSSVDHSLVHGTTNTDTAGLYNPKRRSTVDETNHLTHRSQNATITNEIDNQRRETLNAAVSLLTTQSKPSSSGGVKMRKTAAAAKGKPKSQDYDNSDDNGKTKSSKSYQQQQQQQQSIMKRHDKDESNNKTNNSSRLHHHLSKFSSPSSSTNEDDNEQYSTMLSTVDLRSRGYT